MKQQRKCKICNKRTGNIRNPHLNGKRIYVCQKKECWEEMLSLRTNKPNNLVHKIKISKIKKKKINYIENNIKEYIEQKKYIKTNLYLYGVKVDNLKKFDKICKKMAVSRTKGFNNVIEIISKYI